MVKSSRIFLALAFAGLFCLLSAVSLAIFAVVNVPSFEAMRNEVLVPMKTANGTKTTRRVGPKAPDWAPMGQIANAMLMAVIASEDASFFSHEGIDYHELKEAMKKDLQEKRWARGASTITQQVVKNVFLSPEKTLTRKVKELIWARQLDRALSKHEILCFYVNMAEFGPGVYGVKQAARHYFGIAPSELSARQSAYLAMMLPAPTKYYVYFRQKKLTLWATKRVNQILRVMNRMGFIDDETYRLAQQESLWGEVPQLVDPDAVPAEDDSDLAGEVSPSSVRAPRMDSPPYPGPVENAEAVVEPGGDSPPLLPAPTSDEGDSSSDL